MNNIIKYLVILFILLHLPQSGWCATYKVEINGINYSITGDYVTVIAKSDGTKYSGNITIPEQIEYNSNFYTVKSLGSAFNGCDGLLSLQLPNTIESIGSFSGCSKLKELVVPDPVTQIIETAFLNCSSLESITLGSNITKIGNNAFEGCNKLKSVYISDIEAWCKIQFYTKSGSVAYGTLTYSFASNPLQNGADLYINGEKLEDFEIPESVSSISHFAFRGCSSIKRLIVNHALSICEGGFDGCSNLLSIQKNSNLSVGTDCFRACENLEEIIGEGSLGYGGYEYNSPFAGCTKLRKVQLSSTQVGTDTYYESNKTCSNYLTKMYPFVEEIILSEGTTRIGYDKFYDCSKLVKINIPSSVTTIVNNAFRYSGIKSIYITDLKSWCNIQLGDRYWDNTRNSWGDADARTANPLSGGVDLYLNNEKLVNLIIPDGVEKISNYKFCGCTSIQTLTIPEHITSIETSAFKDCPNLEKVLLPSSSIEFGSEVFYSCEKLLSAGPLESNCNMEYGWTTNIPSNAFSDVSNLQTIIIPSTIESIGESAFRKGNYGELPIENIYINATVPPAISSNTFSKYDATLFVPIDCKDVYSNAAYWKNFNIIELVDIESIEINKEQYDIIVGESTKIEVTILPVKATYKDLYWSIEDPQIAQIDNGVVLGLKTGTTRVTAKTTDGTDLTATCVINVTNPVQSISLSKNLVELEAEESETITASCTPSNADDVTISWHSKDATIATVAEGRINAIRVGETEVVAKSVNGVEAICKVIVNPTIATSVKLNKNSLSLTTGNSDKLEATVLPAKTTNKVVKWESTASNIVSVDGSGNVKALSNGTAKISAITTDGSNLSDECVVTVTTLATSISLNQNNANLIVGQSLSLNAIIQPSTTSNQNIVWKSNNNSCASVTSDGTVSANATGTATITATTSDGTNLSASCVIVVTNPVISVTLDKTSAEMMVGQQIVITASCIPSNADNTSITWSTSDNTVATVENGVVTAKKLGNATITASSANGIEAKCSINVVPTPISSLTLNESTISIVKGQTFTLSCTIFPDDATNKELIWSSDDEGVAKVNDNGVVTGVSTGNTIIYVKAKSNSKISANCKVFVTTPVTSIKLDQEQIELYVEDEIQLRATCSPTDADNTNIRWSSSDSDIADVSNEGYVKTKNEGSVRITVTTTDGTNLSASCDIIVRKVKQYISWNTELSILHEGGEMAELVASSSSGLPVRFNSSDNNVVSIFDLGDVVYANPVHSGKVYVTSFQEGNYKYEPAQSRIEIEVVEIPSSSTKTLIAYYSQSTIIDGIVLELANQITSSNASVFTQKIEPTNDRINSANTNSEVRDSVMNTIALNPNVASSYPTIKTINANINDYDNVIMVYPLWNSLMAAPMQTFNFNNKEVLRNKSVAFIEYDLFDDAGLSSNAKVLRLNSSNIEDINSIIEDWLSDSEATGILQLRENRTMSAKGIYDLHGRKLTKSPSRGIYIENGIKVIK